MILVLTQVLVGIGTQTQIGLRVTLVPITQKVACTCVACGNEIPAGIEQERYAGGFMNREQYPVCVACQPRLDLALIEANMKGDLVIKQGSNPPILTDCMGEAERLHALSQLRAEAHHLGER